MPKLDALQVLSLSGCTGLKDRERQIRELQNVLPKCHIFS